MDTQPPLADAPRWTAVVARAGGQCECRGACGTKHRDQRTRELARCERRQGQRVRKHRSIRLIATPRDPVNDASFVTAASLPPHRLLALCPDCFDGVRRIIRRAEKAMAPQMDDLFDVEPYRAT